MSSAGRSKSGDERVWRPPCLQTARAYGNITVILCAWRRCTGGKAAPWRLAVRKRWVEAIHHSSPENDNSRDAGPLSRDSQDAGTPQPRQSGCRDPSAARKLMNLLISHKHIHQLPQPQLPKMEKAERGQSLFPLAENTKGSDSGLAADSDGCSL